MELHIGSEIKRVAKQLRIGTVELAAKIPMTRQNLDKIYRKKTIDTELLLLISKALNFDFFALYTDRFQLAKGIESMILGNGAKPPVETELDRCKAECEGLRKDLEYAKVIANMAAKNEEVNQKLIASFEERIAQLTGKPVTKVKNPLDDGYIEK